MTPFPTKGVGRLKMQLVLAKTKNSKKANPTLLPSSKINKACLTPFSPFFGFPMAQTKRKPRLSHF
jgi:hypothetical protein